jgi:hypothetical protein
MAARKKARKKAPKKTVKKVLVKISKQRKASVAVVPKASLSNELGLLHKIDNKVTRIDRAINASRWETALGKRASKKAHRISEGERLHRAALEEASLTAKYG